MKCELSEAPLQNPALSKPEAARIRGTYKNKKRMKLLYIYEYSDNDPVSAKGDFLWGKTRQCLRELAQKNGKDFHCDIARGLFHKRINGGTAWRRIANLLWMHVSAPIKLLLYRPDVVFVRTSPPLIQMTYLFWGKLFGARVYPWIMDYHPVFGARSTQKGTLQNKIWSLFDKLDAALLPWAAKAVCLDENMGDLIRERAQGRLQAFVCPTFALNEVEPLDLAKEKASVDQISFLYAGTLGRSHKTDILEKLLARLSKKTKVTLSYCGLTKDAPARLKKIADDANAQFKSYSFIEKYEDLGKFYKEKGFDWGIVLLNEELAGVVSPSKFSGYTSFGLPIVYIGPDRTNAHMICKKFGAGIAICDPEEIDDAVQKFLNPETQPQMASNTAASRTYFSADAAKRLAEFLYGEIY